MISPPTGFPALRAAGGSSLYNPWQPLITPKVVNRTVPLTTVKNARAGARVLYGDLTGISATVLDRELEAVQQIRTLEVTFRYEPRP